jgi:hypothetical protein
MEFDKSEPLEESTRGTNTEMEFIGFKGTSETLRTDYAMWQNFKRDTVLARLGSALQDRSIAYDQSFVYSGPYTLQEIAAYKSKQRFVTFVEVEKNSFDYFYSNLSKQVTGYFGGGSAATALLFLCREDYFLRLRMDLQI